MSAYKSYFLVLFLFVSGCATQQMSGSSQSKQSPSSSGGMPSSSSSSPSSSSSGGMPSSSQTGSSSQQVGQSASSIFNESLGDFDKEMAGERDIIAASNQGNSSMTSQEIADMESLMGSDLDCQIDISGDLGNN